MRTTCRLLGRTNDQALAAQSAAIVVPRWRIGLLIMPTVISIAPMWCFSDTGPRRLLANHNLVGGCVHLSDFFEKIKTECVKARSTQRSIARCARVSILFHAEISERAVRVPRALVRPVVSLRRAGVCAWMQHNGEASGSRTAERAP